MGFNDVIKKSFLEGFTSTDLSTTEIGLALLIAGVLGVYLFGVYRVINRKAFYSKSFNISLVALCLITAAIIMTIQSSVVISLGMVGALSIVRFRTAVKEPMDLVFLFWSISVGIICGAGLFELALLLSLAVTILILVLEAVPVAKAPLLLVVNASDCDAEDAVLEIVKKYTKTCNVKSRSITMSGLDLIVELRVKDGGSLVKEVGGMDVVRSVSLIAHDGEVTY